MFQSQEYNRSYLWRFEWIITWKYYVKKKYATLVRCSYNMNNNNLVDILDTWSRNYFIYSKPSFLSSQNRFFKDKVKTIFKELKVKSETQHQEKIPVTEGMLFKEKNKNKNTNSTWKFLLNLVSLDSLLNITHWANYLSSPNREL